jgi:hypothetical protein
MSGAYTGSLFSHRAKERLPALCAPLVVHLRLTARSRVALSRRFNALVRLAARLPTLFEHLHRRLAPSPVSCISHVNLDLLSKLAHPDLYRALRPSGTIDAV